MAMQLYCADRSVILQCFCDSPTCVYPQLPVSCPVCGFRRAEKPNTTFRCTRDNPHGRQAGIQPQSTYICRVQSSVWRLPKYWPPTPFPPSECVLPPHQRRGYTLAGRWGGGGSIFWKTPDIGLASYLLQYNLSTDTALFFLHCQLTRRYSCILIKTFHQKLCSMYLPLQNLRWRGKTSSSFGGDTAFFFLPHSEMLIVFW